MREISTYIEIAANPERVWHVLTDFESYPRWNPFVERIVGKSEAGTRLEVYIMPPNGKRRTFKPTVLKADVNRELRWRGKLGGIGFLFCGEHFFILTKTGDASTQFTHGERFSGLLIPMLWNSLDTTTRQGFHAFNNSLKIRCESS